RLDGALRAEIEPVGAQSDNFAAERVERVFQEHQLARRVDACALPALRVPRIADFYAIDRGNNVVIAGGADDFAAGDVADRPGEHMPLVVPFQRVGDVRRHRVWRRRGDIPELPQASVGNGSRELVGVRFSERLQTDAVSFEDDGGWMDHALQ